MVSMECLSRLYSVSRRGFGKAYRFNAAPSYFQRIIVATDRLLWGMVANSYMPVTVFGYSIALLSHIYRIKPFSTTNIADRPYLTMIPFSVT